jgi:DNA-binding response OmpR family regulator
MTRPRVLIVEDDAGLRLALEHGLAAEGFDVAAAPDTATACAPRADGGAPDLVLLDWGLPDGSGDEACRRVRDAHPQAEIVMLTGRSEAEGAALAAGCAAFLTKGIQLGDLADELRRVLGHH